MTTVCIKIIPFNVIETHFFNLEAARGCHIATGDLMLYFMRSIKIATTRQKNPTHIHKTVQVVKILDQYYEKWILTMLQPKFSFFTPFHEIILRNTFVEITIILKKIPWRHSRNFSEHFWYRGRFVQKKTSAYNKQSQLSCCNTSSTTNQPKHIGQVKAPPSSHCTNCDCDEFSCCRCCHDASLLPVHNACWFCKKSCNIEWADCEMHNPATCTQAAKYFDPML